MQLEQWQVGELNFVKPMERRIDMRHADELKGMLNEIVDRGVNLVALDLSEVEFVDSSGLGAMLTIYKKLVDTGAFAIVGPQPMVTSLFKLTRTDAFLQIFDNDEEAARVMLG